MRAKQQQAHLATFLKDFFARNSLSTGRAWPRPMSSNRWRPIYPKQLKAVDQLMGWAQTEKIRPAQSQGAGCPKKSFALQFTDSGIRAQRWRDAMDNTSEKTVG